MPTNSRHLPGGFGLDLAGDGLLAADGSTLTVAHTRIQSCARAGILSDSSSGSLTGVVSTENRFGLSLQGDPLLSYDDTCHFAGNTETDILTGGDLAAPEAPPEMPTPP